MPAFILVFYRFIRGLWNGLKDPQFRGLFYWVVGMLAVGTWFYAKFEGWSVLDSLYYSVITLTTVGYGDVYPVTGPGKLMASIIAVLGIGMFALPTGIVGAGFVDEMSRRQKTIQCPHCGKEISGNSR